MQNPDETRKQLRLLRNLGVRVALDDFGSGPVRWRICATWSWTPSSLIAI